MGARRSPCAWPWRKADGGDRSGQPGCWISSWRCESRITASLEGQINNLPGCWSGLFVNITDQVLGGKITTAGGGCGISWRSAEPQPQPIQALAVQPSAARQGDHGGAVGLQPPRGLKLIQVVWRRKRSPRSGPKAKRAVAGGGQGVVWGQPG